MAKFKNQMLEALQAGRSYTWTQPDGGDFASMRAAVKHGQTLTMSPVSDPREIQAGDIVFVKWHEGYITHLVQEIQDDQFLIVNSVGKINGWVKGGEILGRVTYRDEPEPPPSVPVMLEHIAHDLADAAVTDDDRARTGAERVARRVDGQQDLDIGVGPQVDDPVVVEPSGEEQGQRQGHDARHETRSLVHLSLARDAEPTTGGCSVLRRRVGGASGTRRRRAPRVQTSGGPREATARGVALSHAGTRGATTRSSTASSSPARRSTRSTRS